MRALLFFLALYDGIIRKMSQDFELEASVPHNIREIKVGSCALGPVRQGEGSCDDCPIAMSLSGEARELLLRNCMGLRLVVMGCDEVLKCQSPERANTQMS